MDGGNQRVEIGKRPEHRVDVAVIGDVIAEIGHGRGIDGRKPDRIHAEIDQMIEPPRDAAQIADAVAIGILKRPGIYLVDATAFPPTLRQASLQSRVKKRSITPLVPHHHHPSDPRPLRAGRSVRTTPRSEEHTSELQSLMRLSYAVFCLKKKNNT